MKKSILTASIVVLSLAVQAQEGKLVSTWNALESYKKGDGASNLESAIPYIEEAVKHESTIGSTKAWWYRSQVYQFIYSEKELKDKYPNAADEALVSFKKMQELNNPKFKDWKDAVSNMQALSANIFNDGVEAFQKKDFAKAAKNFGYIEPINAIIEEKGGKSAIDLKTALSNTAIASENAQDLPGAIAVYNKLIDKFPDVKFYNIITGLYKKAGMKDELKAVIDKGLAAYPSDKDLLISKVNSFVSEGKSADAIDYLNKLIAQEPKNEQFYVVLAQAHEQAKDEAAARKIYNDLIALNPNTFEGNYGMGALIFNKAKLVTDEMNALGYSKADQVKYEELKKNRAVIFNEAKPYLDKALTIKPDNPSVKAALGNIEALSK